jgi:hypothetical protein
MTVSEFSIPFTSRVKGQTSSLAGNQNRKVFCAALKSNFTKSEAESWQWIDFPAGLFKGLTEDQAECTASSGAVTPSRLGDAEPSTPGAGTPLRTCSTALDERLRIFDPFRAES